LPTRLPGQLRRWAYAAVRRYRPPRNQGHGQRSPDGAQPARQKQRLFLLKATDCLYPCQLCQVRFGNAFPLFPQGCDPRRPPWLPLNTPGIPGAFHPEDNYI